MSLQRGVFCCVSATRGMWYVVFHTSCMTSCAVVRERLLSSRVSSGRAELATGSYLGLAFFRLSALGLGWLEATSYGALRLSAISFGTCGPATPRRGYWGNWGFFCSAFCVLLPPVPRILWCVVCVFCVLRALSSSRSSQDGANTFCFCFCFSSR